MTGLCLAQFKRGIVTPALAMIGLGDDAAVNLLTGTALVESGLTCIRQVTDGGAGPARGLWQMEPVTHDDIWATFLSSTRLDSLARAVLSARAHWPPGADQVTGNAFYACIMARLKYYRAPDALPGAHDAAGQCRMWKRVYNTGLGAGAADPLHVAAFRQAIAA